LIHWGFGGFGDFVWGQKSVVTQKSRFENEKRIPHKFKNLLSLNMLSRKPLTLGEYERVILSSFLKLFKANSNIEQSFGS